MLTFFRRIRKSLIATGAARKYLLYALGEVLLVMVGILLALQVNNWNEWRKDRISEKKVLIEIKESLIQNIARLEGNIESMEGSNQSSDIILTVWQNKSAYSDTLAYHFWRATWPSTLGTSGLYSSGYESLKNTGFNIIVNDSLRKEITFIFEEIVPRLIASFNVNEKYLPIYHEHYKKNFFSFIDDNNQTSYIPFDYNQILEDQYYYSIIQGIRNTRAYYIRITSRAKMQLERVLQLIKDELHGAD